VNSGRILLYTLALDLPGTLDWRLMAKMLAGSLLRNYFAGTVRVIRNTEEPVFRLLREGLEEVHVEEPELLTLGTAQGRVSPEGLRRAREIAGRWKAEAAALVEPGKWDTVMYLDADSVTLRGVEHLLEGEDWEIRYLPEANGGASAAAWAVRGPVYHAVMQEWRMRMQQGTGLRGTPNASPPPATDTPAWSALIEDCRRGLLPWRARKFEPHEILNPLRGTFTWQQCREAAVLHAGKAPAREEFLYAMYMQKYFSDARGTLLNILEM
jgi:hypothetical protein